MTEEPAPPPRRYVRRPKSPLGWIVLALVLLVGVVAIGGLVVRYGVLLPQTRLLIEARANGVKLGRVGRLRVEGLGGDIWRNFTVRKLTIADEKGVWLQADQVAVKWSYLALLQRRLSVDEATAAKVSVFRRPSLTPKTKSKGLPVSTVIDKATFRLETYPAFSVKRGLFDVAAALQLERNGGQVGQASAVSLLHTGDRLDVKFDISKLRPLLIDAKAFEAQGGALAGTLGLPAERPFRAVALARGNQNGGSLVLNAWSGAAQPVVAGGNWTKEGGLIRGRIDMAASTLLTPYVKMFGRELTFSAAGRKAADDYYGIGLRVGAENLWLKARGKADLFRRAAPNGLNIDLTVRDLSRVVDWKFIGSGRIVGVVKGQPDDWTITGTTAIEALRFRDYALAKVTGPARLSLHDTQLDLEATLQGAGGRGSGMIAGLAGAAPKLRLELTRFKDGRVLVRALRLAGAGFALTASGTRGLLGRLDFKGRLEVSNLRAVRPGASGAISASWTASQGGGGKPWLFTADARGQRFRANLGELDRLLGAAPHLTTRGTYDGKVFRIAAASLNGAAGHADAFGVIGPRDAMKLAVSWRAQGPFTAGPVEISGGLTGQGLVSGTLMRPKADLMADIGRLDVPNMPLTRAHAIVSFQKIANTYDGLFSLTGDSAYGPARGKAAFRFMPGGLDLSHLDVDAGGVQATGAVSLRGGAPSTAALQINAGPGALLERGTLTGAVNITAVGGAARADIDVQATGAVLRGAPVFLRTARLTASGPLSALPFRLSADGRSGETPFSVTGTGGYSRVGRQQVVNFNGSGLVRRIEARTAEGARSQLVAQ
ncbi:MAG: translocation/assembly module TamB domain-containing protein, partial [Caulobacteraceae bacterium]